MSSRGICDNTVENLGKGERRKEKGNGMKERTVKKN
jgi:hypothetical protein